MVQAPLTRASLAACASLAVLVAGCEKGRWYEATVEITRIAVVRVDEQKKPVTKDVEISFFECPGDQYEVLRGGADYSACVSKYQVGDKVPIRLHWHKTRDGHYAWDVHDIGGCARPPDPEDEASYTMVQDCADIRVHGAKVGFHCDRVPREKLVAVCPWFRRH